MLPPSVNKRRFQPLSCTQSLIVLNCVKTGQLVIGDYKETLAGGKTIVMLCVQPYQVSKYLKL